VQFAPFLTPDVATIFTYFICALSFGSNYFTGRFLNNYIERIVHSDANVVQVAMYITGLYETRRLIFVFTKPAAHL
jgi:hypothetical protein